MSNNGSVFVGTIDLLSQYREEMSKLIEDMTSSYKSIAPTPRSSEFQKSFQEIGAYIGAYGHITFPLGLSVHRRGVDMVRRHDIDVIDRPLEAQASPQMAIGDSCEASRVADVLRAYGELNARALTAAMGAYLETVRIERRQGKYTGFYPFAMASDIETYEAARSKGMRPERAEQEALADYYDDSRGCAAELAALRVYERERGRR